MKARRLILLSALLPLVLVSCNRSQEQPEGPLSMDGKQIDPFVYGVYGVYDNNVPEPSRPPKGYKPVYMSHYGRHGSRYIEYDTVYTFVAQVLEKAHEDGKLTPLGEDVRSRYMSIYPFFAGKAGLVTTVGLEQHRQIARRMYERYPEVFSDNYVLAYSTTLQRTMKSMEAFFGELSELDPQLQIDSLSTEKEMYYLNPQSPQNPLSTAADKKWKSVNAPWRPEYDEYCRKHIDWYTWSSRLFSDMDYAQGLCRLENFEKDVYFISIHLPGVPVDQVGFFDLFTEDELENIAEFGENYVLYVRTGNYPCAPARGRALAESLLNDFIVKSDMDLAAGKPKVRLRFGHDGCMMAMLSLLDVDGWDGSESDPAKFRDVWDISKICMAANFQMVFYRSESNPDLIFKLMLNERDLVLPLPEVKSRNGHYYRWDDFKAYSEPRIEQALELLKETAE